MGDSSQEIGRRAFAALVSGRWLPLLGAALALLLSLQTLSLGWMGDDFVQRAFVLEHLHAKDTPTPFWDMFDAVGHGRPLDAWVRAAVGQVPWWASTHLSLAFFRPLSVLTHYLDYALWPKSPALMHAHNSLWLAALVLLVGVLYRELLGRGGLAALCLLLYTVDDARVEGTAWIAGRNTVVTAFFVVLTLLLHHRERIGARSVRSVLGVTSARAAVMLALVCALAASEGGIAVWAYLLPHALWIDDTPRKRRMLALAPLAAITIGWQLMYRALGYGAHGSGIYLDPVTTPRLFAAALLPRLAGVLRAEFTLPDVVSSVLPGPLQPLAHGAFYLLMAAMLIAALPRLSRDRPLRALALGSLLAAIPICAVVPAQRLLFLVDLGGSALVAAVIVDGLGRAADAARRGGSALRAIAVVLLLLHVPGALAFGPLGPRALRELNRAIFAMARTLPTGKGTHDKVILILNGPDYFSTMMTCSYLKELGVPTPWLVHILATSTAPVRLGRPNEKSLTLEPEGGFLAEPWSRLVRDPSEKFRQGEVVLIVGMTVVVETLTADGRPARARFELPKLENPLLFWVAWNGQRKRFEQVPLPAVGQVATLPDPGGWSTPL
jgi:hypothetical protein